MLTKHYDHLETYYYESTSVTCLRNRKSNQLFPARPPWTQHYVHILGSIVILHTSINLEHTKQLRLTRPKHYISITLLRAIQSQHHGNMSTLALSIATVLFPCSSSNNLLGFYSYRNTPCPIYLGTAKTYCLGM